MDLGIEGRVALVRGASRGFERNYGGEGGGASPAARFASSGAAEHDGVRSYWRVWLEAWRDLQDVLDAGDEVVALFCNQRQRGRHRASKPMFRRSACCSRSVPAR